MFCSFLRKNLGTLYVKRNEMYGKLLRRNKNVRRGYEKVTREEVASILVKDKYFSKGNYWLKIWQTLVALLGWMIVVLPFIWVFSH